MKIREEMCDKPKLNVLILLPDLYSRLVPARPAVVEIYGNCFPNLGHSVTWIMAEERGGMEIGEETVGGARVLTIPCCAGSSLLHRILNKLHFLWCARKLVDSMLRRGENINVIQARSGAFEGLLAVYLKRKLRIPFVFQYSFPVADGYLQKYKLGHGRIYCVLARLEHTMISFVMKHADLILPISQQMLEELVKEGVPREKMTPLPLAVNPELFSPSVSGESVRMKYNLGGSSVLLYLGTLDRMRQLDILLHMMVLLEETKPGVKLLLVGWGDDRNRLEKLAHELGLADSVVFIGRVPYFGVSQFVAAADVGISLVPPVDMYRVSSPCKLFEYMGVGKPVVANDEISEHKETLKQSGGGILVPFDLEALACAVARLLDDPTVARGMGQKGRSWVVGNRSYDILARQVEQQYFGLLKEGKAESESSKVS